MLNYIVWLFGKR